MVGVIIGFIFIIAIEVIDKIHKSNEYKKDEKLQEELRKDIEFILEEYKEICTNNLEENISTI